MSSNVKCSIYTNPRAQQLVQSSPTEFTQSRRLHQQLPGFTTTPLTLLPQAAATHGVRAVFVKEEGNRADLPAYKILGASWAIFRALCEENNLPLDSKLEDVGLVAQRKGYTLFAATAGNHGRAVARMARILGIQSRIYVDPKVSEEASTNIRSEGATLTVVDGDYNDVVRQAARDARNCPAGLQIEDWSMDASAPMPRWHVGGYGTLFAELQEQMRDRGLAPTHIVVPVGGGTLCHAAVEFAKGRNHGVRVLAVEPEASQCLQHSLQAGSNTQAPEGTTIMKGMVGPQIGAMSWPIVSVGVDTSIVIPEEECLAAWDYLRNQGVNTGPCGAGSFAGFRNVARSPDSFGLTPDSVVVIVCTDGDIKARQLKI
jgi:diaminopropionate ammonia-lyase family